MSPPIASALPGSAAKDYKAESTLARLLGSGTYFDNSTTLLNLSNNLQDLPVLLNSLSSTLYTRNRSLNDKHLADPQKVDTIAKRLMSNHGKVRLAYTRGLCQLKTETDCLQITSASQLNTVIFKEKATAPVGKKFFSLFPGLGYAAGYKVSNSYGMDLCQWC